MNLSITVNENCPAGERVALIDNDTGAVVSCHKSTIDAAKARAMLTGTDPTIDPDLFARCQVSLPPTLAW